MEPPPAAATTPALLVASGVTVDLGRSRVVDGVDLAVAPGEVVAVIGPNGSGKSTLLRALFGAVALRAGSVRLAGEPLHRLSRRRIARLVAVVNQERAPAGALLVRELVGLGRLPHRTMIGGATAADDEAVDDALDRTGLTALANRPVAELSGGERQRTMVARGLAQRAPLLLLDEPTNHLDLHHQHELLELLVESASGCLVVLHDPNLATRYAHRMVMLDQGRVVASGRPDEVCQPELFEAVYRLRPTVVSDSGTRQLLFGGRRR